MQGSQRHDAALHTGKLGHPLGVWLLGWYVWQLSMRIGVPLLLNSSAQRVTLCAGPQLSILTPSKPVFTMKSTSCW